MVDCADRGVSFCCWAVLIFAKGFALARSFTACSKNNTQPPALITAWNREQTLAIHVQSGDL
jgi:hypothetical protein